MDSTPKRPLGLTVIIFLLGLSTLKGMQVLLYERDFFVSEFPGATLPVLVAYGLTAMAILAGLYGLWGLKRWSVPILLAATALTLILDFVALAPPVHKMGSLLSMALVFWFSRPVWPVLLRKTDE